jgi:NTP pyrophosphatase (non-canonical NTP hydrolase)
MTKKSSCKTCKYNLGKDAYGMMMFGNAYRCGATNSTSLDTGNCSDYKKKGQTMNFKEYQQRSLGTAVYPNVGNNLYYPVLGLAGEAGEVAEKVKKIIRDNNGIITDDSRESLTKELGDVLWYISAISNEIGVTLNDVAEANIDKLFSRKERNKLRGSGDNR